MIPPAHGGRLVDRRLSPRERERREAEAKDLLKISPFIDQVYDAEKIGIGAYSPLEGFQDSGTLESIPHLWPPPERPSLDNADLARTVRCQESRGGGAGPRGGRRRTGRLRGRPVRLAARRREVPVRQAPVRPRGVRDDGPQASERSGPSGSRRDRARRASGPPSTPRPPDRGSRVGPHRDACGVRPPGLEERRGLSDPERAAHGPRVPPTVHAGEGGRRRAP